MPFWDSKKKVEDANFKKYKFKSIKTYSSTEWLYNTKRYRTVFHNQELSYLYCEVVFYNKLFDEIDWEASMTLKCFRLSNGEELCSMEVPLQVTTNLNQVEVRKGWGSAEKGSFWVKGEYEWRITLDGEHLATKRFYVHDEGEVTPNDNPYFNLLNFQLFESSATLPHKEDRKYYLQFDQKSTRYIWGEIEIDPLISRNWMSEFFINFYTQNGEYKGRSQELQLIESGRTNIICTGWGTNEGGSWRNGKYYAELVFMDQPLGVVSLDVGDGFVEGLVTPDQMRKNIFQTDADPEVAGALNEVTLEESLEKLNELIGLEDVKTQINEYISYLKFLKLRREKGFEESSKFKLHAILTGNPGTGKTTVAKLLGKIYKSMGLLSKGHVHEVDRADLVGEYIGQTAPKVHEAIKRARGGILFIDEAYALHREDSPRDYGNEVIEVLLKEMSDGPGDLAVIAAGYPAEMKSFIQSNPGLKSRFNHYFHFSDFTPEELMAIADLAMEKRMLSITEEAKDYLFVKLTQAFRDRDRSFGNARFVMSVVDEAKMNMGLRLVDQNTEKLSDEELSTLTIDDVRKVFYKPHRDNLNIHVDQTLLRESLDELDELIGLDEVKQEVHELVKLVKYYRDIGKDVLNQFVLHSVYVGNPGTGKTTVARIMAKLFRALGILEKGHLVEVDREALVAGFSGQTAKQTAKKIDEAIGGVLFIDEAYALVQGSGDSFGQEAVNTLLKRMEDRRNEFVVIAAGYPDNMKTFLETNPGLKSRFERKLTFEDFSTEELMSIMNLLIQKEDLKLHYEARNHLTKYVNALVETKDKYFGNARAIRKIVAEAVKNQHLRMASMDPSDRTTLKIHTLMLEDVAEFKVEDVKKGRVGKIGFGND